MKHIFTFLIILSTQLGQAQEEIKNEEIHHCLVEKKTFSFGLGIPYSFELSTLGINSRLYYNAGEVLCFGPEFSYFKKDEDMIWDVDFVVHYIIETPWLGMYPVLGINYTKESSEYKTEDAIGFLWGAGMHRNFNKITLFAEYTRVESTLSDNFLTVGLMYRFKLSQDGSN